MKLTYSNHWILKKRKRDNISDDLIEYAVQNSNEIRDKYWEDASNAICRVPPSGRLLKVVYKRIGKDKIKIITSFWID